MITGLLFCVCLAQTQTYPYVSATVTVTVTDETGAPIPERAVSMYYNLSEAYDPNATGHVSAVTDANGVATLAGNLFTGTWRLRVSGGSQFETAVTEVVISQGQSAYEQQITLHRSRGGRFAQRRTILIDVIGVAPDGSRIPIAGATVTDASGNIGITGSSGRATMTHNGVIGDLRAYTAAPPDGAMWTPNSNTAVIGQFGNSTRNSDYLLIELKPGPAYHAPNDTSEKTLTISILDHDSDQPVSGAVVNLIGTAGQTLTSGTTAAQGELYFTKLNGYTDGLRVQVLANGYRGALQNVPAELFDNGNALYTVYLYKAAVWQGRWIGGDTTFSIGATDMSGLFFITYERTVQNLRETGTFGCRVDPSQNGSASCNWQGHAVYHYDSGDVANDTSGTATLIMQGDNTISMSITRTVPNPATYSFSITRSP
jgi:hypothetical protein